MNKRVLIIEDEKGLSRFMNEVLSDQEFTTRVASTGRDGLQMASEFLPHLILLDLGLPDMDGFEIIQKLRTWFYSPIVVVSAKDSPPDKVHALNIGADDYLTKPFNVQEMIARVRVAFRHLDSVQGSQVFKHQCLTVDLENPAVFIEDTKVTLTSTEFEILKVLIKKAGKVVTYETLLREVWGPRSEEHTQYLRVYVGQIRKKLRIHPQVPELIMTETGIGYRLG